MEHTWHKTSFGEAQKRPDDEEISVVSNKAQTHANDAPGDGKKGQPDSRTGLLQHQVAGQLGRDVKGKEDGESVGILTVGQPQIFLKAQDFGVSNVGSVKKGA